MTTTRSSTRREAGLPRSLYGGSTDVVRRSSPASRRTLGSSLPPTGPGRSYAEPVHCASLPMAMQIAQRRGGPIMCEVITKNGITQVLKAFPCGRVEVAP